MQVNDTKRGEKDCMNSSVSVLSDISYGKHERHKVDIFIPGKVKAGSGVILFIHGGGWSDGDKSVHHPDAQFFCERGFISAVMNYRFVSEVLNVSDELDDITAALKKIKEVCAEKGFSAEKLILSGGSAGAHLALLYSYLRRDASPVLPVAVCVYCPPVSCFAEDFLLGISGEFEEWKYSVLSACCGERLTKDSFCGASQQEALRRISPIEYVTPQCIPTAVFYGARDELIPVSHIKAFIKLLEENNVTNESLVYENSGHALDKDPETALDAKKIILKYAEKYF